MFTLPIFELYPALRHKNQIMTGSKPKLGLTKTRVLEIWLKTMGKCAYCGCQLTQDNKTIDHIRPKKLYKGGNQNPNTIQNLILSCKKCNLNKGSKITEIMKISVTHIKNKENIEVYCSKTVAIAVDKIGKGAFTVIPCKVHTEDKVRKSVPELLEYLEKYGYSF